MKFLKNQQKMSKKKKETVFLSKENNNKYLSLERPQRSFWNNYLDDTQNLKIFNEMLSEILVKMLHF